jgi:hypothetical protein
MVPELYADSAQSILMIANAFDDLWSFMQSQVLWSRLRHVSIFRLKINGGDYVFK